MRTKRRGIKTCLVVVAVFISLLGIVSMADAGNFANALANLSLSSSNNAMAHYMGIYSLWLGYMGWNGDAYVYYSYVYMNSAASFSYTALNYAAAGYNANQSNTNYYYAWLYTYRDYYAKRDAAAHLLYIYNYNSDYTIPDAIYDSSFGDFYNGIAMQYCGYSCNGGSN